MTYNKWISSLTKEDYAWYYAMYSGDMKLAYENECEDK